MKLVRLFRATRWFAIVGIGAEACASTPKPTPDYGAGLRYGAECAPARDRARSSKPPTDIAPPHPVELWVPPFPVPERLKGHTVKVTVRVDSAGYPVRNALQITGVDDTNYMAQLRKSVARIRYRPAALDGCAVDGTALLTYMF